MLNPFSPAGAKLGKAAPQRGLVLGAEWSHRHDAFLSGSFPGADYSRQESAGTI